jgi:LDH2 family malate/lactate/ureidoglycolate dehydrogenase
MPLGQVSLSVADARDLAEGALRGIGYHDDGARIIAEHVIDAALCGYEYSGLAKILNIPESEHFNAGLAAIHTAASSRLVAPPGGAGAVLGTNPIAIAIPSSRRPIVLDMGTSAYMMTEVMLTVGVVATRGKGEHGRYALDTTVGLLR